MNYSRYLMVAFVPFAAAALIPWVEPKASGRVLAITLAWGAFLIVFLAGLIAGNVAVSIGAKTHLSVLSALGCCSLAFLAIALYWVISPFLGLMLITLAFYCVVQLLQVTALWQRLNHQKITFYRKLIWAVLGCLLMLALSYYRHQIAI